MMDVLIIDDVQFFGKEKTKDVFFHIFNHRIKRGSKLSDVGQSACGDARGATLLSRFGGD